MLHREEGQVGGGSERNQAAAGQLFGYFGQYVYQLRNDPALAARYTKIFLEANVDGRSLSDALFWRGLWAVWVRHHHTGGCRH